MDRSGYPISLVDAADQSPSLAPGPDRPVGVKIVCRLTGVIHDRIFITTGAQHNASSCFQRAWGLQDLALDQGVINPKEFPPI